MKDTLSKLIDKTPNRSTAVRFAIKKKLTSKFGVAGEVEKDQGGEQSLPQLKAAVRKVFHEKAGEIQQLIYNHKEAEMPTIKQEFGNKLARELVSPTKRQLSVDLMASTKTRMASSLSPPRGQGADGTLAASAAQAAQSRQNDRLSLIQRQQYLMDFGNALLKKAVIHNEYYQ
jgi:hypothetical protein